MLTPRHPSGEESLGSFAKIGGQPEGKGTSGRASHCPKCGHYSLRVRREPRAGRSPGSRLRGLQRPRTHRGLVHRFRRGLTRIFLAGQVRGRVGSGAIPRRGVFGSRRGRGSLRRGNPPGRHGVSPSHGSRAGNSVRSHLRVGRLLSPSFARHRLQPWGAAISFNMTRVAASILLAHSLAAREVRSRGLNFPWCGSRGRLCDQISGEGRPTKKAPRD
jgi:hypothetical protein